MCFQTKQILKYNHRVTISRNTQFHPGMSTGNNKKRRGCRHWPKLSRIWIQYNANRGVHCTSSGSSPDSNVMAVVVTKVTEYQSFSQSQSKSSFLIYICEFLNSNPGMENTYPHYRLLWFYSIPQTNVWVVFYNWYVPYPYYLLIICNYKYASLVVYTKWNPSRICPVAPPIQYFYSITK